MASQADGIAAPRDCDAILAARRPQEKVPLILVGKPAIIIGGFRP
jgi:hypothetical protein